MRIYDKTVADMAGMYKCSGCGTPGSCAERYIVLELANGDGTLRKSDFASSYFHNEHCVAQCILHGEAFLKGQP